MSTTEKAQREQGDQRQRLLGRESVAVDEHRAVPSAAKLVDARKILIAHVKEIAASGNAEKDYIARQARTLGLERSEQPG